MAVPHSGQVPRVPSVPEDVNSALGFTISLFSLHFTQYACKKTSVTTIMLISNIYQVPELHQANGVVKQLNKRSDSLTNRFTAPITYDL
jgi:hypothetical protein